MQKRRARDAYAGVEPGPSTASLPALEVPAHVAIIMDGNGRWAKSRGLPRLAGHRAGTENIRPVARCFAEHGVKHLTLFAFSTENWTRPEEEVTGLFDLLADVIEQQTEELHGEGVRLRHLGRVDRLPESLQSSIASAVALTKDNDAFELSVAFDYGGRDEILQAVRRLLADGVAPEDLDESRLAQRLYTSDVPDPDLIIRTAGEMRLSNFLLWQGAYAEHYVTDACWPDFDRSEAIRALEAYRGRRRSFGGVRPNGAG
ncbi:MAG: polyprenyl diphosphate synthase [Chloroflexota bacterium]|nr:polyprenyl diphosphate synthase [Chloroflexota bacterium]